MSSKLFIQGELSSIKTTEFKGEKVSKLQFLNENDNGGLEVLEVKIDLEYFNNEIKKGDKLTVPISMSQMNGKIYYKTSGKIVVSK
ncbi:MAG: hypothetical protein Q8S36_10040 [Sulfuricurvum sp.]|nr:hypothetical protein [Sulfuricurvum sp.]